MSQLSTLPRRELPPALPRNTSTFEVAAQVIATGPQDSTVQATAPLVGTGQGQIAVRVGRVVVYVTDRDALQAFVSAWTEAQTLADQAFGPKMPPPVYRPRLSDTR
ncbi:hypothetical protein [Humibacillus xanthopallidus]|uniref:hypothetical protein n=1 Tax=Humibacillus xanthopallidus TaxID=412689 RepID=UPI00384BE919